MTRCWDMAIWSFSHSSRTSEIRHRRPDPQVILYSVQCCYAVHWTDNCSVYIVKIELNILYFHLQFWPSICPLTRQSGIAFITVELMMSVYLVRDVCLLCMQTKLAVYIRDRVRPTATDNQHYSVISVHHWARLVCCWNRSYIRQLHRYQGNISSSFLHF